jgi:hypothetical protein
MTLTPCTHFGDVYCEHMGNLSGLGAFKRNQYVSKKEVFFCFYICETYFTPDMKRTEIHITSKHCYFISVLTATVAMVKYRDNHARDAQTYNTLLLV